MLKIKKSYLQTLNCNFDTSALFSIISSSLSDLRAEGLSLSKDELCTLNFEFDYIDRNIFILSSTGGCVENNDKNQLEIEVRFLKGFTIKR